MKEQKDIFDFIEKRKTETPDASYFANLAQSVIDEQKTKVVPLYKIPAIWVSVAAAILIVALIFIVPAESSISKTPDTLLGLEQLSNEEILAYVEDNLDEFDIELIAEFVPEKTIENSINTIELEITPEKTETSGHATGISFEGVSKEEILDYLEEEEIDIYELDDDSFI